MVKLYISLLVLTLSMSSALAFRGMGMIRGARRILRGGNSHGGQTSNNYDQNPSRREYLDARDTYDDYLEARDFSGNYYRRELLQRALDAEELWGREYDSDELRSREYGDFLVERDDFDDLD